MPHLLKEPLDVMQAFYGDAAATPCDLQNTALEVDAPRVFYCEAVLITTADQSLGTCIWAGHTFLLVG